jgi:hypothetical protein
VSKSTSSTSTNSMQWLTYALLTVSFWGVYGIFLHKGSMGMADPVSGRYKAFLWVGVAYFLVAIVAPLVLLIGKGGNWWHMPEKGVLWSLIAGVVGALGAFGVLLAFGAGGTPTVVMSIIFAGAPCINAIVQMVWHPPQGNIPWQFYLGILLAATGGCLVTYFKPADKPPPKPPARVQVMDSSRYNIS